MNHFKKKRVIFLVAHPFQKRDFERFGIQNWINHNWKVNIYDLTKILNKYFWEYIDGHRISINFKGLIIFENMDEILTKLSNSEETTVFINQLGNSFNEKRILRLAQKFGILINLRINSIPKIKSNNISRDKFLDFIFNPLAKLKNTFKSIKKIIENFINHKISFDYEVICGHESFVSVKDKKTNIIKGHNLDYDFFLKSKKIKLKKKNNYLVFLDEFVPYHPDEHYRREFSEIDPKTYYNDIDVGLNEIAKKFNLKIIIAAHPRSDYENVAFKYKYPIIKDRTFYLIKNADLVVGHASTSLQIAILMKKPILIITIDEIKNSKNIFTKYYSNNIDLFAKELGKKVINLKKISYLNKLIKYSDVNVKKYQNYTKKYIKLKSSPKKLLWEIVIERLEKDIFKNF